MTVFQDQKLFGAQFGELENIYKIIQETQHGDLALAFRPLITLCCIFRGPSIFYYSLFYLKIFTTKLCVNYYKYFLSFVNTDSDVFKNVKSAHLYT